MKCATLKRVLFASDTCRRGDSDALVVWCQLSDNPLRQKCLSCTHLKHDVWITINSEKPIQQWFSRMTLSLVNIIGKCGNEWVKILFDGNPCIVEFLRPRFMLSIDMKHMKTNLARSFLHSLQPCQPSNWTLWRHMETMRFDYDVILGNCSAHENFTLVIWTLLVVCPSQGNF